MTMSLEDRGARLERFRYAALGFINAQNTVITDLWCNFVNKADSDPIATIQRLKAGWLADADQPNSKFPGSDPAHFEILSQEYRDAIELLANEMLKKLQLGPTRRP